MTGVESTHAIVRARDKLVEAGFITFQKGKKGCPNRYYLKKQCKNVTVSVTENVTENGTISVTESVTTNGTHIKTKTKNNTPDIMTTAGTVPMGTKIEKPDFTMIQEKPPVKSCPFVDGISSNCRGETCAFYDGEKCKPGTAQAGKRCPIRGRLACGEDCAMFDNGCCALYSSRKEDNE